MGSGAHLALLGREASSSCGGCWICGSCSCSGLRLGEGEAPGTVPASGWARVGGRSGAVCLWHLGSSATHQVSGCGAEGDRRLCRAVGRRDSGGPLGARRRAKVCVRGGRGVWSRSLMGRGWPLMEGGWGGVEVGSGAWLVGGRVEGAGVAVRREQASLQMGAHHLPSPCPLGLQSPEAVPSPLLAPGASPVSCPARDCDRSRLRVGTVGLAARLGQGQWGVGPVSIPGAPLGFLKCPHSSAPEPAKGLPLCVQQPETRDSGRARGP